MDTKNAPHEFLKVPEVAAILRIARSQAYDLVANGTIPAVMIGQRSVRVSREAIDRYVEEHDYLSAKQ